VISAWAKASGIKVANGIPFELLGAAPARITGAGDIAWPDTDLARTLFKADDHNIPLRLSELEARLTDNGRRARREAVKSLSWEGAQYRVRYQMLCFDGVMRWMEERGKRLSLPTNKTAEEPDEDDIITVFVNVDKAVHDQAQAGYLAHHDKLTGLWNSARLAEALNPLKKFAGLADMQLNLFTVAIENFDQLQSDYGFAALDYLVRSVAGFLSRHIEDHVGLARMTDQRFSWIMLSPPDADINAIVKAYRERLNTERWNSQQGELPVLFDLSALAVTDASDTAFAVDRQGAQEMPDFIAPENVVAGPAPKRRSSDISGDFILSALNDRRFELAFQPIVGSQSHKLHHYECLMRIRDDSGRVSSAGRLILIAEELGLVHLIDHRALELASDALRHYPELHLALNVSAGTILDPEAAESYIATLKALGKDAERVTLEMTETVALDDPDRASRFSQEIRALGCAFSVDDFGSGYTTFHNLLSVEAECIKIDGSFIQDITSSPHKQKFIRMIVDLARTFGVETVAECIESREEAELLARLGVDYLQGYYFGVPEAAPNWVRKAG